MLEEEQFDPRCESYSVALRAIIKLFNRRRYEELAQIGVHDRDSLTVWSMSCSDLRTDEEIFRLLQFYPGLVGSLIVIVGVYQLKVKQSRKEYYRV